MLLIQNNGLLASINALKAIALEARVPTFMLVGQFSFRANFLAAPREHFLPLRHNGHDAGKRLEK